MGDSNHNNITKMMNFHHSKIINIENTYKE
jgi:hypothetical protein